MREGDRGWLLDRKHVNNEDKRAVFQRRKRWRERWRERWGERWREVEREMGREVERAVEREGQ